VLGDAEMRRSPKNEERGIPENSRQLLIFQQPAKPKSTVLFIQRLIGYSQFMHTGLPQATPSIHVGD
jgi:hypothetical protein